MARAPRRVLAALGVTVGILLTAAPSAAAADATVATSTRAQTAIPLDGFVITRLPATLGPLQTTFEYEYDDVVFHSRVWETLPDADHGYRVDLTMKTLRGDSLTDLEALRRFLTEYGEHDPEQWRLRPLQVGRYRGFLADNQAFWFVAPGIAASVTIDRSRYTRTDLLDTARGFRLLDQSA